MTEQPLKPVLQKPPGYRDPGAPAVRPAPMRKAVLPVSFRTEKRRRNWCRLCCCFAVLFLLLLILASVIAAGLFYLWFDPKLPVFHLQSVRIPRFNVTARPDDGTYLDASVMARIEAKNPNSRLEIYYGVTRVGFRVPGEDTGLGSDSVAGFAQGKSNTTSLKVETTVKSQLVVDGVGKRLKSRFKSKELVVEIRARTRVGYLVRGMRVGSVGLSVTCGGVSLRKLNDGDMPRCSMEMLKWGGTPGKLAQSLVPERVRLERQLQNYIEHVRSDDYFCAIEKIGDLTQIMVETGKEKVFPLVYQLLTLAFTLPIATASVERSFSSMKFVKTDLCNKMGDDQLTLMTFGAKNRR